MEKLIEITDPKEMEKFVKSSNYLLVDDGLDKHQSLTIHRAVMGGGDEASFDKCTP
mgnify:CR=1 FL=1